MERLKNLKMLLTILFIAAAGSLFLYDGKRTSDVQWQTAEETALETECLDMTPEENTDKAETESACAEPEMIYVYICVMSDSRMFILWRRVRGFMRRLKRPAAQRMMLICSN